ncbi:hypothetical protein AA0114_g8337 [Alternaria tenuissima]|uniref:Uncharacterized protein n=1 Tax=Alternaria tenuissima TaxID=119927 RepID=A0A4Q4M9P0_9PLEO|nr:hypothetical protein AA0114_g8337 [Alternaria tenuissima]
MYVAVTILYLTAGSASSVVGVIAIALAITACGILFQNQQFITILGTICAVLVTLLNDGSKQPRPTQTQPALAASKICKAV